MTHVMFRSMVWLVLAQVVLAQPSELVSTEELHTAGLVRHWGLNLPLETGSHLGQVHVVDDSLYVFTEVGNLHCIDRHGGLIRWVRPVVRQGHAFWPPTHLTGAGGRRLTAVVTRHEVQLYDAADGEPVAAMQLDFVPTTSAVGAGQIVLMGGADQRIHALARQTSQYQRPIEIWEAMAPGGLLSTPLLLSPDVLFFASHSGEIATCTTQNKQAIWVRQVGKPISLDATLSDDGLYLADDYGQIHRIGLADGSLLQRYRLPSPAAQPPIVDAKTVYALARDRTFYALDLVSGETRWQHRPTMDLVARQLDRVTVLEPDHWLVFLSSETGEELTRLEIYRVDRVARNRLDDAVYVMDNRGTIECLRPLGVELLSPPGLTAAALRRHVSGEEAPEDASAPVKESARAKRPADDPLRSPSTLPPIAGGP